MTSILNGALNSDRLPTATADGSPLEPSAIIITNAIIKIIIITGAEIMNAYIFLISSINDHQHYQTTPFLLLLNEFELVNEYLDL